jgi:hypothetical protein
MLQLGAYLLATAGAAPCFGANWIACALLKNMNRADSQTSWRMTMALVTLTFGVSTYLMLQAQIACTVRPISGHMSSTSGLAFLFTGVAASFFLVPVWGVALVITWLRGRKVAQ